MGNRDCHYCGGWGWDSDPRRARVNIALLIFGMALVTYLPRLLPALILDRFHFPDWFNRWLKSIPYAALGALIFPGVLLVDQDQPLIGLLGGMTALVLSLLDLHVTLVMAGSISAVLLVQYFL
jgi:branched-subunit amino acid transport protein